MLPVVYSGPLASNNAAVTWYYVCLQWLKPKPNDLDIKAQSINNQSWSLEMLPFRTVQRSCCNTFHSLWEPTTEEEPANDRVYIVRPAVHLVWTWTRRKKGENERERKKRARGVTKNGMRGEKMRTCLETSLGSIRWQFSLRNQFSYVFTRPLHKTEIAQHFHSVHTLLHQKETSSQDWNWHYTVVSVWPHSNHFARVGNRGQHVWSAVSGGELCQPRVVPS